MERRHQSWTVGNKVNGRNSTRQVLIPFFILKTVGGYWRILSREKRSDFHLRNNYSGDWIRGGQEWIEGDQVRDCYCSNAGERWWHWTGGMVVQWEEMNRFNKRVISQTLIMSWQWGLREKQVLRMTLSFRFSQPVGQWCYPLRHCREKENIQIYAFVSFPQSIEKGYWEIEKQITLESCPVAFQFKGRVTDHWSYDCDFQKVLNSGHWGCNSYCASCTVLSQHLQQAGDMQMTSSLRCTPINSLG